MRLSWRFLAARPDVAQLAYRIQTSADPAFAHILADTGAINSKDQIAVPAPGDPLASREVRSYRVKAELNEEWTDWSPVLTLEAGLLDASDWLARAITVPDDPGDKTQAPSPLLRRDFRLDDRVAKARLHVTSLGVHRVSINGQGVADNLLNPGWTSYHRRLLTSTYDVGALLAEGSNVMSAVLGDGWYRGRLGWDPEGGRCNYGSELGLIAQLEIDLVSGARVVLISDETWLVSTGETRSADLYDGCVIDLRERQDGWDRVDFDSGTWQPARVIPHDTRVLEPLIAPPVRVVAELPAARVGERDSETIFDGGQNISGFVRLRVRGRRGQRVIVRHAEVLESDGSLHTRSLRSARATDEHTLADDGETVLEPMFTFHGFRYAGVSSDAEIMSATFLAISSDLTKRGRFECSDTSLSRLHENVVWSQRDNFVSIPTDCPQRDERLGWTGDAQAFAATASTLFHSEAFWRSWLRDLALDQDPDLGVSTVVPDVVLEGPSRFGRAGWGDAATIVPWAVYESYGDPTVIRDQFPSMCQWVDSLEACREKSGLLPTSMQFGDWLDPDAPGDRPWEAKTDPTFIGNCFFTLSARLTADAAALLGEPDLAKHYRELADDVGTRTWVEWQSHAYETQTGCALALQLGIAPDELRARVAATLATLVSAVGGRVATGFLGTPLVLPALSSHGYFDEAYLMLLRRDYPSWLYQVDHGATTVWERWDAIRTDGSIHPGDMAAAPQTGNKEGHMLSFNHYAYGAVVDWVYRNLAGIAPDRDRPGYEHIVFAPKPAAGIDWASASVDTPRGRAAILWRVGADGSMTAEVDVPFGATAEFRPPSDQTPRLLAHGHHKLEVVGVRIADPALALANVR